MSSRFSERHSRSTKTLSIQRPRPSIEMRGAGREQDAGEGRAGELAALVGVEDFRLALPRQRLFERLDAKQNAFIAILRSERIGPSFEGPRLVRPAMQAGQRRPGQRVECLPARTAGRQGRQASGASLSSSPATAPAKLSGSDDSLQRSQAENFCSATNKPSVRHDQRKDRVSLGDGPSMGARNASYSLHGNLRRIPANLKRRK